MKIAMVSEHASPLAALGGVDAGGQNVHVAALARELGRMGAEVVVHTRRDAPELPRRVSLAPRVTVDHVSAGPPRQIAKDDLLRYMDAFAADLSRRWSADPPDVVHSHFWMSGRAGLAAARPLGVPVTHTFHALGVVKQRHQGAADTSPAARSATERRIIRQADRILATCADETAELAALGVDLRKVRIVPCGVDLEHFRPTVPARARRPGLRRIVVVGRLVQRKGIDDVITALRGVPGAELIIAGGPGEDQLADDSEATRLRALAIQSGVADRVELLGAVARPDMPGLLRSADLVVCVPWYEPFGIVPLEAMACGVPVIASAVGGLTDTVVHGLTGLHVPPRRPDLLAGALRGLLDDDGRRAAMGAAGVFRARSRYGWARVAEMTLDAYRELVVDVAPAEAMLP